MILHEGRIAEMKTGEGKTLVAVLAAYLNALNGKGVHVVTVNDYLARRDSEWVGQVHRFLGLKVGLIQTDMNNSERQENYAADVTYVTNSELGFDYLRDNLALAPETLVQRDFNFCIIDEVDSILIDEARTPLIISSTAEKPSGKYFKAKKLADALAEDVHFTLEEKQRNVIITEDGYLAAEEVLGVRDLYDPRNPWAQYLLNALKAKALFNKDVHYIVRDDEIIIVDEFTGRTMPGRRWSDGLHQAIEAKEGVPIQNENVTIASISYQNFFRLFPKLGGMTGTANTEAGEFSDIYNLPVSVVPTNVPNARSDASDVVFKKPYAKWDAVVTEIKRMNKQGRPVLVGTTAVETSEMLGEMLGKEGLAYQLLNAKPENVERESEIVAQSGRKGMVTLATNMAGRGTDILLGGNPEFMARLKLRELLLPQIVDPKEDPNKPKRSILTAKDRSWKVEEGLFPCELPSDLQAECDAAIQAAVKAWGFQDLGELEGEERLSFVCEKAPTEDVVYTQLRAAFHKLQALYKQYTDREKQEVIDAGGLHVIGTERHESRRIDNQLRGRAGRQGDPGSSRFFLSMEDNLFRIFGGERMQGMMEMFRIDDLPIESKILTDSLDTAQKKVESFFFDQRKSLYDYDQVLNTQRDVVYAERKKALLQESLTSVMEEYSKKTVDDILQANLEREKEIDEWDLGSLAGKMVQYCYLLEGLDAKTLRANANDYATLQKFLHQLCVRAYQKKRQQVLDHIREPCKQMDVEPDIIIGQLERTTMLTNIDNFWQEHLEAIRYLRQAVSLRGFGQRDPLTEYKLEAYKLFIDMMARIRRNVIYNVYLTDPEQIKFRDPEQVKKLYGKQSKEDGEGGNGDGQKPGV